MSRSYLRYGWKPDLPDFRDLKFAAATRTMTALPSSVDLRPGCPPVYDQGQLGCCTGNAIAAAIQFELLKQKMDAFLPSRLFIYYNERVLEDAVDIDHGAQLRDGIKTVNKQGVCPETMWPYVVSDFTKQPDANCYASALLCKAVSYQRIEQDEHLMKGCLAEGYPFLAGFTVYTAFEGTDIVTSGVLNLPGIDERVVGGHAVLVVGYDDASRRFLVRNSWGAGWGQAGHFTIPYEYLTNSDLASDFWTIRMVEGGSGVAGASGEASVGAKALVAAAVAGASTANFDVAFLSGGAADTVTLEHTRNGRSLNQQQMDFKGGRLSFGDVQGEDVFIVSGVCLGTCQIKVDIPMKNGPQPSYGKGHFFDNLIV